MLVLKNQTTLVTYLVLALALVEASSHSSGAVSRRDHSNLKRMVKKRSPFPATSKEDKNLAADDFPDIPVIGAAADPLSSSSSVVPSASASSSGSVSVSASSVSVSASSVSVSASASASASASSPPPSSSSSSSSSPTAVQNLPTEAASPSKATVVLVSTAGLPQETANTSAPSGASNQTTKSSILTAVIAVAASVGGLVILWTIFRKWKLGRSKQFDQRLQPIDWQPTSHDDGDGIVPPHRRLSGASFRSGTGARNYGSASDAGHGSSEYGTTDRLQIIPDHDFTAGPSLAPVGGYADLSRGPSPQPQMTERAPAMTSAGYDANVPLHHQGYGSQDTYGGVRY